MTFTNPELRNPDSQQNTADYFLMIKGWEMFIYFYIFFLDCGIFKRIKILSKKTKSERWLLCDYEYLIQVQKWNRILENMTFRSLKS